VVYSKTEQDTGGKKTGKSGMVHEGQQPKGGPLLEGGDFVRGQGGGTEEMAMMPCIQVNDQQRGRN